MRRCFPGGGIDRGDRHSDNSIPQRAKVFDFELDDVAATEKRAALGARPPPTVPEPRISPGRRVSSVEAWAIICSNFQ